MSDNMILEFLLGVFGAKAPEHYLLVWTLGSHRSAWFTDVEAAARYVTAHQEEDCYVGIGLAGQPMGEFRRCKASDVVALAGFVVDIDYGPDRKGYPETAEQALMLLKAAPLPPSYVVHTGHGYHGWWLFEEPVPITNEQERGELHWLSQAWGNTIKALAHERGFNIDSVFDLARVMRCPGTLNCKDASPVRCAVVEQNDWRAASLDVFYEHIRDQSPPTEFALPQDVSDETVLQLNPKADPPFEKFQVLAANEPRFAESFERTRKDVKGWSASEYDMSLASFAAAARWTDQEIADLLIAGRRKAGDDLKLRLDYYTNLINKARKSAARNYASEEMAVLEPGDPLAPDALATYLGVRIERVIRYKQRNGTGLYYIHVAGQRMQIGDVDNLRTMRKFVSAVEDAVLRHIKVSKDDWEIVLSLLYGMVEQIDLGEEVDEQRQTSAWVEQYLESFRRLPDEPTEVNVAAINRSPFIQDDKVWFTLGSFRFWLLNSLDERPTTMMLAASLREMGCVGRAQAIHMPSGRWTTYSVWSAPDAIGKGIIAAQAPKVQPLSQPSQESWWK